MVDLNIFQAYFKILLILVLLLNLVSDQLTFSNEKSPSIVSNFEGSSPPIINAYENSEVPFCAGIIPPINRLLADAFLTRLPLNETGRSDSALSLCNIGNLLFNEIDEISTKQVNRSNYSTCRFMQERGFCTSDEESACDLSYIIFLQTMINGSLQTICTCLVKNNNTVYCVSGCSARWKDVGLWVFTADQKLFRVKCISDSTLMSSQTSGDTIINIYVDLLLVDGTMTVSSAPNSVTQQTDDIIFAKMVSPNIYCNSQTDNQSLSIKITPGLHIQSPNTVQEFLAFSPNWARCRYSDSEGEVLIDDECKPFGIRFIPPRLYLDLFYKTSLSPFYDPKCLLFFIPFN